MMLTQKRIAVVGSRAFTNWQQLKTTVDDFCEIDDTLVSGGATGADSMAQRYAKEKGKQILIIYPSYAQFGRPATFIRNKIIVENADIVLAFYQKGRFQQGGTANTAEWARKLGVTLHEFEEIGGGGVT
jgi:predicted Rossmann fold nucleotide-binding protein DprA/Smf involved in DNA uptake